MIKELNDLLQALGHDHRCPYSLVFEGNFTADIVHHVAYHFGQLHYRIAELEAQVAQLTTAANRLLG